MLLLLQFTSFDRSPESSSNKSSSQTKQEGRGMPPSLGPSLLSGPPPSARRRPRPGLDTVSASGLIGHQARSHHNHPAACSAVGGGGGGGDEGRIQSERSTLLWGMSSHASSLPTTRTVNIQNPPHGHIYTGVKSSICFVLKFALPPSSPLLPLSCKFQNKTGTETLTS